MSDFTLITIKETGRLNSPNKRGNNWIFLLSSPLFPNIRVCASSIRMPFSILYYGFIVLRITATKTLQFFSFSFVVLKLFHKKYCDYISKQSFLNNLVFDAIELAIVNLKQVLRKIQKPRAVYYCAHAHYNKTS